MQTWAENKNKTRLISVMDLITSFFPKINVSLQAGRNNSSPRRRNCKDFLKTTNRALTDWRTNCKINIVGANNVTLIYHFGSNWVSFHDKFY